MGYSVSTTQIDHILTFANVNNIDEYVAEYRTIGFVVNEATYRYKPGLRNRFITLGCEYIELVWVEDEAAFAESSPEEFARMFPDLPALREVAHPFSIGFQTASVNALHDTWTSQGYDLPSIWSFAPPGMPPVLSFQTIPSTLLPGVSGFALTYHNAAENQVHEAQMGPNTIYALEGITMVCATPATDAALWRDLLAPDLAVQDQGSVCTVNVGAHTVHWMTPEQYHAGYGLDQIETPHDSGNIAALHLLASDLDKAKAMLGSSGNSALSAENSEQSHVKMSDPRDGLTFIIREYPIDRWCNERMALTGERIAVDPQ